MFGAFYDFDRPFLLLDELRRRMDRVWEDLDSNRFEGAGSGPRANLWDTGEALVLQAEIPGLSEKDVTLTLNADSLTLKGSHKLQVPEGYSVHRQERSGFEVLRTFAFPTRIDPEKVTAVVKDGLLTVTLTKAADVRPRQITVKAS